MPNTHDTLAGLFGDIADAIRGKTGGSAEIVADDFPSAISAIPSVIVKEVVATNANYITILPDTGEDFHGLNNAMLMLSQTLILSSTEYSFVVGVHAFPSDREGYDTCTRLLIVSDEDFHASGTYVNNVFQGTAIVIAGPMSSEQFIAGKKYTAVLWRG